jgi:hypothetical protein
MSRLALAALRHTDLATLAAPIRELPFFLEPGQSLSYPVRYHFFDKYGTHEFGHSLALCVSGEFSPR